MERSVSDGGKALARTILFLQCGGGEAVKTEPLSIARSLGYRIAVFQKGYHNEYGVADEWFDVDVSKVDVVLSAAAQYVRTHDVAAVLTLTEWAVEQTAAVTNVLRYPGLSERAAHLCRNKFLQRDALEQAGIPQPRYALASGRDECISQGASVGYPLIIKPLNFGGSSLVARVDREADMPDTIDRLYSDHASAPVHLWSFDSLKDYWLLEEYIAGAELSVESVTQNGRTDVLAVHDKMVPVEGPLFLEQYFVTPSPRLDAATEAEIMEITRRAHEAVGFDFGLSHTEFRLSPEGPKLVELNGRVGGGLTALSVKHSTGIDMYEVLVRMALGEDVSLAQRTRRPTALSVSYAPQGIVTSVRGIAEAEALPNVRLVKPWFAEGDRIKMAPVGYAADVLATADTPQEAYEAVRLANALIVFEVDAAGHG